MSSWRISGLILLALWLVTAVLQAQWRVLILTTPGPDEGMPSIINRIVPDSTGYLYRASNEGLYRYDGHQFTFYGHDPLDDQSIGAGGVLNIWYFLILICRA